MTTEEASREASAALNRPPERPFITLNEGQTRAVCKIREWFLDPLECCNQHFKCGGLAGTGKTTIIRSVLQRLDLKDEEYKIVSFTGKAVDVIQRKGMSNACTLHSLIYRPVPQKDGTVKFHKLGVLDEDYKLIIFDEASMCSKDLYDDLVSFGIKILWVGDPGQLEPVGHDINLMSKCDIVLEEIMRQASDNPIIRFAHDVRLNHPFLRRTGEYLNIIPRSAGEMLLSDKGIDVIITAFNRDRKTLNATIRRLRGFRASEPSVGERIIICRNNSSLGVFNGQLLRITNTVKSDSATITVDAENEVGERYNKLKLWRKGCDDVTLKMAYDNKDRAVWDFGYALTCHKAQGSEWDNVLVFEPKWWGPPDKPMFNASRWRYTAVTRARTKLTYCF